MNVGIEKQNVFQSIKEARAEIIVKTLEPFSEISILKIDGFENNNLICTPKQKSTFLPDSGELIVQIFTGSEKYYALMKYQKKLDSYYLDTSKNLFHLQRREDFRLKIPASFRAFAQLKSVNGNVVLKKMPLLDFSGGGCRIEAENGLLKHKCEIDFELQFQSRPPFPVKGVVKHLAPHPDQPGIEWVGVQFAELSEPIKNKIIAIKLDIYRELFSKLK
jgi:hypothetical protein